MPDPYTVFVILVNFLITTACTEVINCDKFYVMTKPKLVVFDLGKSRPSCLISLFHLSKTSLMCRGLGDVSANNFDV